MASGPISLWQIEGEKLEAVTDFIFLGSKITVGRLLLLLLSHFSRVRLLATPWTAAYQAPLSMGFSRQKYWRGCHCLLWWADYSHEILSNTH